MQLLSHDWPWVRRYGFPIIFGVVYLLLSMVIIEQGRTIDSQRTLIRSLFQDSVALTHLKIQHQAESLRR